MPRVMIDGAAREMSEQDFLVHVGNVVGSAASYAWMTAAAAGATAAPTYPPVGLLEQARLRELSPQIVDVTLRGALEDAARNLDLMVAANEDLLVEVLAYTGQPAPKSQAEWQRFIDRLNRKHPNGPALLLLPQMRGPVKALLAAYDGLAEARDRVLARIRELDAQAGAQFDRLTPLPRPVDLAETLQGGAAAS